MFLTFTKTMDHRSQNCVHRILLFQAEQSCETPSLHSKILGYFTMSHVHFFHAAQRPGVLTCYMSQFAKTLRFQPDSEMPIPSSLTTQ